MDQSEFVFRATAVADVEELIALVHRCYGDSYFDTFYYSSTELEAALISGHLRSFIAVTKTGSVVAHIGVRIPDLYYTAVSSLAIVDPAYRSMGLLAKVGFPLYQLCVEKQFSVIHGQAVTVHTYTQQTNLKGGAAVTGIYMNYIPAGQRFIETESLIVDAASPGVIMVTRSHHPQIESPIFPPLIVSKCCRHLVLVKCIEIFCKNNSLPRLIVY